MSLSPRCSRVVSLCLLVLGGCLVACTEGDFVEGDTVEIDTIELWQHGEPVPLAAARQAETAEVWIDPAPFELQFEGCALSTTTTLADDLSNGFVGREAGEMCTSPTNGFPTFGRCNTVALEPETAWLWHNASDERLYEWRVTLLDPRTGAEPVPDRPGWCRFVVEGVRTGESLGFEPLETFDTDGDALVISAWNALDEDGWESVGELVHIHVQL